MARICLILPLLLLLLHSCLGVEVNEPMQQEPAAEPIVNVFLCCQLNEDLDKPSNGQVGCVPSKERFHPLIYSLSTSNFLMEIPSSWSLRPNTRPTCSSANESLRYIAASKQRANPYVLLDVDASVSLNGGSGLSFEPGEFCLGHSGLLACMPRTNESHQAAATMRPKLSKCCGENAAYAPLTRSCVEVEGERFISLEEEKPLLLGEGTANGNTSLPMEMTNGFPECPNNLTIIGVMAKAELQSNGSVNYMGQNVPSEKFCIERVKATNGSPLIAHIIACSEHAAQKSQSYDIRFTLYPVGFIISAIFLAATLAAGCLLPASHHVLHWRCQTHHVACLMLGDISMAVIQLAGSHLTGEWCRAIAILAHFFFLATFFWLNTMCFNIWWTFRDLRPASLEKGQELMRLRFYGAYAWGGPLIVAGLAAFLDHLPKTPGETFLRPRFGEKQCWFVGDMEILAYFFGPIGVLLAINLIFFAATARELTCGLWKGEFVKSTTERAALGKVCLKLVVVMGVPWIFDVISWLAGGPAFLWYVTDLCNAAQGVLIFIVVGCQPQVRAALKRFCSRNPRANGNRQGNGLSTTSHGMPSMGDSVTQNPSTKTAPLETIC